MLWHFIRGLHDLQGYGGKIGWQLGFGMKISFIMQIGGGWQIGNRCLTKYKLISYLYTNSNIIPAKIICFN